MTESIAPTPHPDLKIISSRVYRGPNVWHYEPAIQLVVDLGVLEDFPTNMLPGFADALVERLPGLAEPHLQPRPARRVRRAAARGHLGRARGRACRAATAAGRRTRHAARQDPPGQGRARPLQRDLRLQRRVGRPGRRRAGRPAGQRPDRARPGVRLRGRAGALHRPRRADRIRSLHPGDRRRGGQPGHPLSPAEHRVAGPARPGRPPEADPGDHDLADLLGRGRHRQQQGAHPERCCRPPDCRCPSRRRCGPSTTPSGWPTGPAIPWCSSRWTATTAAA